MNHTSHACQSGSSRVWIPDLCGEAVGKTNVNAANTFGNLLKCGVFCVIVRDFFSHSHGCFKKDSHIIPPNLEYLEFCGDGGEGRDIRRGGAHLPANEGRFQARKQRRSRFVFLGLLVPFVFRHDLSGEPTSLLGDRSGQFNSNGGQRVNRKQTGPIDTPLLHHLESTLRVDSGKVADDCAQCVSASEYRRVCAARKERRPVGGKSEELLLQGLSLPYEFEGLVD